MTNHPQRNWRRRMHEQAAAWLLRHHAPAQVGLLTAEQLLDAMRRSYLQGYTDGRESRAPPRSQRQP